MWIKSRFQVLHEAVDPDAGCALFANLPSYNNAYGVFFIYLHTLYWHFIPFVWGRERGWDWDAPPSLPFSEFSSIYPIMESNIKTTRYTPIEGIKWSVCLNWASASAPFVKIVYVYLYVAENKFHVDHYKGSRSKGQLYLMWSYYDDKEMHEH